MMRFAERIGANYLWGLINYTLGVGSGGLVVAAALMGWRFS